MRLALWLRWAGAQTGDFKNTPVVKVIIGDVSSHRGLLQSLVFIRLRPVIDAEMKKNKSYRAPLQAVWSIQVLCFPVLMFVTTGFISCPALASWAGERSPRRSRLKLRDDVLVTAQQSAAHSPVTDVCEFQLPGKNRLHWPKEKSLLIHSFISSTSDGQNYCIRRNANCESHIKNTLILISINVSWKFHLESEVIIFLNLY